MIDLEKYVGLKDFCIMNGIKYISLYKLIKKVENNEIEMILIDKRTRLFNKWELYKIAEPLLLKHIIKEKQKTLSNKWILGYDRNFEPDYSTEKIYD